MGLTKSASKATILEAMADAKLFGSQFEGGSWAAWRSFLAALFGLPLTADQVETFTKHTERETPPDEPFSESFVVCGRRGGKSRIAALIGVYLACFRDYSSVLAPGERGVVMLLASDRRQAQVTMQYIKALLDVPLLRGKVQRELRESIDLDGRVTIEVHTASFRSTRGFTIVAAILDELAFWRSDELSANPDTEVVSALRPAMATVPGSILLGISSPYSRRGVLWQKFHRHFGQEDSRTLIWQAESRAMNPTIEQSLIDEALQEDPAAASAEWLAQFRTDVESFVNREVVEACVVSGRYELPRRYGIQYHAFVDSSGGQRDSAALAIGHREGDQAVLDLIREAPAPHNPEHVVAEFASVMRTYGLRRCQGDRYSAQWVVERFRQNGIDYRPAEKVKSVLYAELLPALNSQQVELLDNTRMINQLLLLERRTGRGRDVIDHAPGVRVHDDVANAVAGAVALTSEKRKRLVFSGSERTGRVGPEGGEEAMKRRIARTHERLERQARSAWEIEKRYADEPMRSAPVWRAHGEQGN